MSEDFINVLWVENDPLLIDKMSYPLEAEDYGIHLVPFTCWEHAAKELEDNFDNWSAIILDAKCKFKNDDIDNASRFLVNVFPELERIYRNKQRHLNWYILSAGGAEIGDLDNLIPDTRMKWDKDWGKKYYSKNVDRSALFERIRKQVSYSDEQTISEIVYKDVFDAITDCQLNDKAKNCMIKLLLPIHFNKITDNGYNDRFYYARHVLEYVFRSMIERGILPSSVRTLSTGKDQINLSLSSKLLAGISDKRIPYSYCRVIFPKIIADSVRNIIFICGADVHTSENVSKNVIDVNAHLKYTNNSPYLLRAITFQLCDLLIWYKEFLKENPDEEINATWWEEI